MRLVCVRKTLTIVRHLTSVLPACHWRIVSVHRTSSKRLYNVLVASTERTQRCPSVSKPFSERTGTVVLALGVMPTTLIYKKG